MCTLEILYKNVLESVCVHAGVVMVGSELAEKMWGNLNGAQCRGGSRIFSIGGLSVAAHNGIHFHKLVLATPNN